MFTGKIIDCTTMKGKVDGHIAIVAMFENGSMESIGTFFEHETKAEAVLPRLIGCTYLEAKHIINSIG